MTFDYSLDFKNINFREHPELYRICRGEQGVLLVKPYKKDIVGMDMARKFLQMGYTRSQRYANHKSGRKYKEGTKEVLVREEDPVKAEFSAEIL